MASLPAPSYAATYHTSPPALASTPSLSAASLAPTAATKPKAPTKPKKGRPPLSAKLERDKAFPPHPRMPFCLCGHLEDMGLVEGGDAGRGGERFKGGEREKLVVAVRMRMVLEEESGRDEEGGGKRVKRHHLSCSVDRCASPMTRPLVCLSCGFLACSTPSPSSGSLAIGEHMATHLKSTGHVFCIEILSSTLYCIRCRDFIHHPSFESIYREVLVTHEEASCLNQGLRSSSPARDRIPYVAPPAGDIVKSLPRSCAHERGVLNLGNTCYLSSVLQLFLHTPLFRSHFLGDRHHPGSCVRGKKRVANGAGERATGMECLGCEVDGVFQESVKDEHGASGDAGGGSAGAPIVPTSFLYCVWRTCRDLAGYGQQDAHEFLIAALNQIHLTSPAHSNLSCSCITHLAFGGSLRSVLRCTSCSKSSTTVEDFIDLSLEIGKGGGGGGNGNGRRGGDVERTLEGCLRRFVRKEKLEMKEWKCEQCGSGEGEKQLSVKRLPMTLCIQIKRFQKSKTVSKIDHHISFPLTLNMRPYTSPSFDFSSPVGPDSLYTYHLTSVIVHYGELNTGHYTAYGKMRDEWTFFDDEKVREASTKEVLDCKAYVLCYEKLTRAFGEGTGGGKEGKK
ncbi:cysteine proteinase [Atractiella rhizophila]|nr:cysteine proteinase [Atractiella rhizophila]